MQQQPNIDMFSHISIEPIDIAFRLIATIDATTNASDNDEWYIESEDVESYKILNQRNEVIAYGFKNFYDAWLLVYTRMRGKSLANSIIKR